LPDPQPHPGSAGTLIDVILRAHRWLDVSCQILSGKETHAMEHYVIVLLVGLILGLLIGVSISRPNIVGR
jgi:hypothetical protein